ncbi:hypothetical protein K6V78_11585 [Streptococcus gallolyticus]|nr:hypothetical protein [Streptococcus gallolyticus]MBY5042230.1 hypothetical protein [Streptococcus gallolyticus]
MKTIHKILLIATAILLMSGCTALERRDYESRIAEVSEVYPTERVSDLFKKFPNGFEIYHKKEEVLEGGKTFFHRIDLVGDPETKRISGQYRKLSVDYKELLTVPVVYDDVNGLTAQEDYQFEPAMQDFAFAFQKVDLSKEEMGKMTFMDVASNPALGTYSIRYEITNQTLNHYLGLPDETQLEIDFGGDKRSKKRGITHINIWIMKDLKTYMREGIIEYLKEGEEDDK